MMKPLLEQLIEVILTLGFLAGLAMTILFINYLFRQIQKLLRHDRNK